MRRCVVVTKSVVILLALAQSFAKTTDGRAYGDQKVPRTVDEAVQILKTSWLSKRDLDWILRNPRGEVVSRLYRPFGNRVRNEFGLWRGTNPELRDSCGQSGPEECSGVILDRLWESVRADADPSTVKQLDCQFQLLEAIHINPKGFYKLTTGELIGSLRRQIDGELSRLTKNGMLACQSSLTIEVIGKPDMHCFVAAERVKRDTATARDLTLKFALARLGFQNLFSTSHMPPKLALVFERKCQFPAPPHM